MARKSAVEEFEIVGDEVAAPTQARPAATARRTMAAGARGSGPLRWVAASMALIAAGVLAAPPLPQRAQEFISNPPEVPDIPDVRTAPVESHFLAANLMAPIEPLWSTQIDQSESGYVNVAVSGDRVLTQDAETLRGDIELELVRGYDASDGAPVWEQQLLVRSQCGITRSPVLCIGDGPDGTVVARIDPDSGATDVAEVENAIAAMYFDGDLVVLSGDAESLRLSRYAGFDTAAARWSTALQGDGAWELGPQSLDVDGLLSSDAILVNRSASDVEVVDAETGASALLITPDPRGASGVPTPAWITEDGREDLTFYTSDAGLAADSDGAVLWTLAAPAPRTLLAHISGVVVLADVFHVSGHSVATGEERWRREDISVSEACVGAPTTLLCAADVSTGGAALVALDPETGETQWAAPIPGGMIRRATVQGDRLAVLTDTSLTLFDLANMD